MLKYVDVELFSRATTSSKARFYKEGDISNEATYQPKFENPDYRNGEDLMLYFIVNPKAKNAEIKVDLSYKRAEAKPGNRHKEYESSSGEGGSWITWLFLGIGGLFTCACCCWCA
jgi:hypothetical protein